MIVKIGENLTFSKDDILSPKQAFEDKEVAKRFVKMAKKLRRLAPKANDFVYFSSTMMNSAEAALIDQNTGEPILNKKGKPVQGYFEDFKNDKGQDSVKWISPDDIKPYKNHNGDIFSESELLKAHKNWRGAPLCKDHQSDSIEGVRGIVIDTYYCPKFKRLHALSAIDKKNYGDLARKVETGYARCVSMGTGVGRSVCSSCGNVAKTERDYCKCIHAKSNYGEYNLDLNPIELSLVVNGADPLATIKNVIASMNTYAQEKQEHIEKLSAQKCVNPTELQSLSDSINDMQSKLKGIMHIEKAATIDADRIAQLTAAYRSLKDAGAQEAAAKVLKEIEALTEQPEETEQKWPPVRPGAGGPSFSPMSNEGYEGRTTQQPIGLDPSQRFASKEGDKQGALKELSLLRSKIDSMQKSLNALNTKEKTMNSARLRARAEMRRAYWNGGGGVNEPTPGKPKYEKDPTADKVRDSEDRQMTGEPLETGSEGLHPGDKEVKEKLLRAEDLQERAMKRRAYFQGGGGVNEPTPGKPKYEKDGAAEQVRNTDDKQMTGTYEMGGTDGMVPSDEKTKKMLLRARLRARFTKVADSTGDIRKDASRWEVFAGDKMIISATGSEIFGEKLDENWDYLSSQDYGKDVISTIRSEGFDRVAYLLKGAAPPAPATDPLAAPGVAAEPAMDLGMPEAGPADAAPPAEVEVDQPKDEAQGKVDAALNTIEEKIAEIREEVGGIGDELVDINVNVSDKDDSGAEVAESAPMDEALASRKDLLKVEALLNDSADELALISEALDKSSVHSEGMLKATAQALEDGETLLSEAKKKMEKCDGCGKPKQFCKKDDCVEKKEDDKEDDDDGDKDKDKDKDKKEDKKDSKKEAAKKDKKEDKKKKDDEDEDEDKDKKEDKKDKDDDDDDKKEAQKLLDDALKVRAQNRAELLKKSEDVEYKLPEGTKPPEGAVVADADDAACDGCDGCDDCSDAVEDFVLESEESVVASRKRDREQLVAEAADKILGKYELDLGPASNATEPKYFEAHPGGKGTVTELTHTKTDGAKVETISEVHDVMRDVAESGPRNVREAAMMIQEEITKGAFKASDLDQLVAEGKVDSAAASYWKKYWAQGPDTGSFGADLSKEFTSAKKEAADSNYKVKIRRAYDLGIEAQDKNIIGPSRMALDKYVDEVMEFDDPAFESTKRIIANMNPNTSNGDIPRVGVGADSKPISVTASDESVTDPLTGLDNLGWK